MASSRFQIGCRGSVVCTRAGSAVDVGAPASTEGADDTFRFEEAGMERASYDLVVLGSGPAGEKGAAQAAYFGKKVALIEPLAPLVGGACTNTGTLPSKTMRESALALTGMMSRGLEAAVLALPKPWSGATLLYREHLVVESERKRIRKNLEREGIDVFAGLGSFVVAHTVQVKQPVGSEPKSFTCERNHGVTGA